MEKEIITNIQIEKAFENTNFGSADHRKLLEQGVLKCIAGYYSGYTLTTIMRELKLISKSKFEVLKKGKLFLYDSFKDSVHTG